jgi:hypothetical protein
MTAEEFYEDYVDFKVVPKKNYKDKDLLEDTHLAMIEFAKYHVEQALKKASEEASITHKYINHHSTPPEYEVNKDSIINAYSLENIK